MDIESLTVKELRELARLASGLLGAPCAAPVADTSIEVGQSYLFWTVTFFYTGRVARITANDLVLEDAAWVADTGRLNAALKAEKFAEVEPCPNPIILRHSAIVACTRLSKLPKEVVG